MTHTPAPGPQDTPTSPTPGLADGTPVPSAPKKRGPGKWIGLGCLGCGGLVFLIVIIMIIVSAMSGGDDDAAPSPEATQSEEATEESTEEATTEAAPEETTEAESEPATEDPAEDLQAWADSIDEQARIGSDSWLDYCGGDYSSGTCYVNGVRADVAGEVTVTIQVAGDDDEVKGFGEDVANTFFANAGTDNADLDWVIVENSEGVVVAQKQRSDFPHLQ